MRILPVFALLFVLGCPAAWAADAVPATAFFPVLPFDAPADALPQLVPLAANQPLDGVHAGVTRAIIVIHDETRDANAALASLAALAGTANASTMILAPQFLLPSDLARFADHLPDKGRAFAAWSLTGWATGDDSVPVPGRKSVSSFTVADLLLMVLADRNSFPDLREIVIAGYGAGANFAQRYAAFGVGIDVVAAQNIDLRTIVAAAPSYLYLTATRPLGGRKGFGQPDVAACPDYNTYPYGLEKIQPYARHVGANAAKTNYATRFVTYLNALAGDSLPDTSCAAMLQGSDGTARFASYRLYLQSLYGDTAARTQIFVLPKEAKSDAVGLFGSACGMAVLFGDGYCPPAFGEVQ